MRIVTTTENYLTIPGTDTEVRVDGPMPNSQDDVHRIDNADGSATLAWMIYDDTGCGPEYEWPDGATFRDFRDSRDGGGQEARDTFIAEMVAERGEAHVHVVEVYSHGLESFSRVDAGRFYPDRQWDVCPACVLVTPADVPDPATFADAVLAEYTSWCNGDVYGCVRVHVPADYDGAELEAFDVWGFIGYDFAKACIESGDF